MYHNSTFRQHHDLNKQTSHSVRLSFLTHMLMHYLNFQDYQAHLHHTNRIQTD